MARDDFSPETIRKLGERVGLMCSNPDCRALTKGPHTVSAKAANIGKACHIHAASPGGPRYDPLQSADERSAIQNGIWLCSNCSAQVDNDAPRFPADLLRTWRNDAERSARARLGQPAAKADPSAVAMSGDAAEVMRWLTDEYVKASFPNHKVWTFTFKHRDSNAAELRALGLLEPFGSRGRDGQEFRFTDAGQRWVMAKRGA